MAGCEPDGRERVLPGGGAWTLHLLGPFQLLLAGTPPSRLSRRAAHLLALLTLRQDRPAVRSWLAGTLWPESAETQGLANLRDLLKDVRRSLGPWARHLTAPTPRTLHLDLTSADVDLTTFHLLLARDDGLSRERAVAIYRGPLLEGWSEEWVFEERRAREELFLTALESLAAAARGEPARAVAYLRRAVETDPLRESAQRSLMEALAAAGSYAAAMEVYRDLRQRLLHDLNAAPAPETAALYARLRADARERARAAPERERERAQGASGPLRSLPRVRSGGPGLPRPLTALIGWEKEVADTRAALMTARLVTLTGAGGVGKTRMALQVATEMDLKFADGACLVELAALHDATLVPQAVASALGVPEQPGRALTETLLSALRLRQMLLVLDNCEHLIDACARLVECLLYGCPDVQVLATSRQSLGLFGEISRRVPSLAVPDVLPPGAPLPPPETLLQSDAVRLFVERATAVTTSFAWTALTAAGTIEICRRLDGIPLAIELAAALVKVLPVTAIAARLDDRFRLLTGGSRTALPRHRTLRALIDWSYDLLSPAEQFLLRRLSVFAGGCSLAAAQTLCARDGQEGSDVIRPLTGLVEKSLVGVESQGDTARYHLLETVRQYARERLEEAGEAEATQRRHCDWCLALTEQGESGVPLQSQTAWLERMDRERDNLRAALSWCEGVSQCAPAGRVADGEGSQPVSVKPATGSARTDAAALGLKLGVMHWLYWNSRGYFSEGREHLARLLALPEAQAPTTARAAALDSAARLAERQGDYATAWASHRESLAMFRELQDQRGIVLSYHGLAMVATVRREYDTACALAEQGLPLAREVGDREYTAYLLSVLGMGAFQRGDHAGARRHWEESLAIHREIVNSWGIAQSLSFLGRLAGQEGRYGIARTFFERSIAIYRELGTKPNIAYSLAGLGMVACSEEDYWAARSYWQESLAIFQEVGALQGMTVGLEGLASVAAGQGEPERAARLFGAAQVLRQESGVPVQPTQRAAYERTVATVRAALGEEVFASIWAEGRTLSLKDAVEYALSGRSTGDAE